MTQSHRLLKNRNKKVFVVADFILLIALTVTISFITLLNLHNI